MNISSAFWILAIQATVTMNCYTQQLPKLYLQTNNKSVHINHEFTLKYTLQYADTGYSKQPNLFSLKFSDTLNFKVVSTSYMGGTYDFSDKETKSTNSLVCEIVLQPKLLGTFSIGKAAVDVGGKQVESNEVTVTVHDSIHLMGRSELRQAYNGFSRELYEHIDTIVRIKVEKSSIPDPLCIGDSMSFIIALYNGYKDSVSWKNDSVFHLLYVNKNKPTVFGRIEDGVSEAGYWFYPMYRAEKSGFCKLSLGEYSDSFHVLDVYTKGIRVYPRYYRENIKPNSPYLTFINGEMLPLKNKMYKMALKQFRSIDTKPLILDKKSAAMGLVAECAAKMSATEMESIFGNNQNFLVSNNQSPINFELKWHCIQNSSRKEINTEK